jgi:hypothetical protein
MLAVQENYEKDQKGIKAIAKANFCFVQERRLIYENWKFKEAFWN